LSFSIITLDLYLTARAAQRDAEDISKQWSKRAMQLEAEQREFSTKAVPLHFINILELLRQGQIGQANYMCGYFEDGSRELIAAVFLISPQPLKDKEVEFRRLLGEEQAWFADFIIGEHHLKDRNKEQAISVYRSSFQAIQKMRANNQPVETWLVNIVEARLYELTTTDEKLKRSSAGEPNE
jgi:hypothetical protein